MVMMHTIFDWHRYNKLLFFLCKLLNLATVIDKMFTNDVSITDLVPFLNE